MLIIVILRDDFSIWCFSVEGECVVQIYLYFMFLYSDIKFMNFMFVL
jgi:hypothetical protein